MEQLLNRLKNAQPKSASETQKGAWRLIQFSIDPVTGEKINVGVALETMNGTSIRLINNLKPFKCFYGSEAMENILFSFELFRGMMDSQDQLIVPSSNFELGNQRVVSYTDPTILLNSLFEQMVPLSRFEEEGEEIADSPNRSINTPLLTRKIFGEIRSQNHHLYSRICRDEPVTIQDNQGDLHRIVMPIWVEAELYKGHHFGSIVSTWQKSKDKRKLDLNESYRYLDTAKKLGTVQSARGGMFILRPKIEDNPEYSEIIEQIDNEIDDVSWMMRKQDIHLEVAESVKELTNLTLAFAA